MKRNYIMKTSSRKKIKASEFDKLFDEGKDVSNYLDLKGAKMEHPTHRINIDIPEEMLLQIDKEATRIGVPRTSLLKLWIAERVDTIHQSSRP